MSDEKPIKNNKGSFFPIVFVTAISLLMAVFWDQVPALKNSVHYVLDPSAGALLNWNLTIGMIVVVFIITLITTLIQKYTTDQNALRELRKEQKILQEEMKIHKDHPEKLNELSKKQLEAIPKTFRLTSRAVLFTGIPFILFFRWFYDFFNVLTVANNGIAPVFFGFISWFWFYLIFTLIFSGILRKWLNVV
ncbi:Uncharacterised protein [uncultured archaeon]|nr:Uncharacterised protein [uncultured archaeon]